jgi:GTPase SAR1 family protein
MKICQLFLGLDFVTVDYSTKSQPERSFKIKIWDTAKQERFKTLTASIYNYDGVIIAYNISSQSSFESVRNWLEQIISDDLLKVLVAYRTNDDDYRVITTNFGKLLTSSNNCKYFEISSQITSYSDDYMN